MTGPPPPGKRIGPATNRPDPKAIATQDDGTSITVPADNGARYARRHVVSCIHGRPRFCQPCLGRRRRVAFLLDELLADLYPAGWHR